MKIHQVKTASYSELGLLGLAFHPKFSKNRKIYLNYTPKISGRPWTRISEWVLPKPTNGKWKGLHSERILLEVQQPFSNHNAGQLAFGPKGFLFIGLGDGGSGGDPLGHGQNGKTFLGSMLRIDVDKKVNRKHYAIPKDNPFRSNPKYLPEIWAIGLRNPWKYSFTPKGELVVADVGQNTLEEVSIVHKGANLGWKIKEASICYPSGIKCKRNGFTDPIFEYGRKDGVSITGGYVYQGKKLPKLMGKYLFGDFGSGQIWALDLKTKKGISLGKHGIAISTFGKKQNGEILVGDYNSGKIFSLR